MMNLLILILVGYVCHRIVQWIIRIIRIKKTMPVIPVLIHPWSILRLAWPRRYQAWHKDWQFHQRRHFRNLGTYITPLISLFGNDAIYVADAEAIVEISRDSTRFPKDLRVYGTHLSQGTVN